MNGKEKAIQDYLNTHGLLLCNENKYLPSIFDVGGDWDSIVALIEKREAFSCKIFKKRTTYLSRELYFLLRGYKQSVLGLPELSVSIYDFLKDNGPADTETIKNVLMISSKSFNSAFDILLERLLVTAVKRGKTLGESWCTFVWGTYEEWEKSAAPAAVREDAYERLYRLLNTNLTEKEIKKIIS